MRKPCKFVSLISDEDIEFLENLIQKEKNSVFAAERMSYCHLLRDSVLTKFHKNIKFKEIQYQDILMHGKNQAERDRRIFQKAEEIRN